MGETWFLLLEQKILEDRTLKMIEVSIELET